MKTVKGENTLVPQIEDPCLEYSFHPYLIVENAIVYNVLTNETVKDIDIENDRSELIKRWFMTPKGMDLKSVIYYLRQIRGRNHSTVANDYTIFTTMKCNASCPYCFQHGGADSDMSIQTAKDVSKYIQNTSNNQRQIKLRWFGGEPLVNKEVITTICSNLRDKNLNYISHMSTNGDLFCNVTDAEIYLWNLKVVQLTLDTFGIDYDEVKGLPKGAYDRLKDTCKRLESLGVGVNMRVHYHPTVGKDPVLRIIDDFRGFSNIRMYAALLYDVKHVPEDYEQMFELENKMLEAGLIRYDIMTSTGVHYCMADSTNSRCIRVDGSLTPCEHYFEGETVGTIYSNAFDDELIKKWRSKRKHRDNCENCPLYPSCNILSNCPSVGKCEEGYNDFLINRIRRVLRQIGGSNEQK